MRHSTNITPPPYHHNHNRSRLKNRPCPNTLMTPRSPPRTRPNNRAYPLNLTKTSPLCPPPTNSTHQFIPPNHARPHIYPYRGMRRTKPNTTTKNPCLLLNRTPRLNDPSTAILPLPHPLNPPHIPHYDILNISCI